MSTHTKGPWDVVTRRLDHIVDGSDALVLVGNGFFVAACSLGAEPPRDTEKANARLIAASPALLEACEFLLTQCTDAGCNVLDGGDVEAGFNQAIDAIAKAKGGAE